MEKKKLKTIVCGTTFGQFYMEALKRSSDEFEFAGIFAHGSERSVECARMYGVPLYTQFEDIPEDIDLACVVIRSGALGGKGTALALKFMEHHVNVIQEQPVHYKDLAVCMKAAIKNKVYFKTGDLYVHLPEVKRFIETAKELQKHQNIIYVNASCCPQVSYPLIDILERFMPTIKPLEFTAIVNERGPFHTGTAMLGKVPVVLNYNNEIDPNDPDNFMQLLHSIVIGFEGGHLQLADTFGPVLWTARLHIPVGGYNTGIARQKVPEHMKYNISQVLGDYKSFSFVDMITELFPDAVGSDLHEIHNYICNKADMNKIGQRELITSSQWHKMTKAFGFASLKYDCKHMPISPDIVETAAERIKYDIKSTSSQPIGSESLQ